MKSRGSKTVILTRAPNRISIFGGGTEYNSWLNAGNEGLVVGGSINTYSYIMLRKLPDFFKYKTKLAYSEIECVKDNKDIQHKVIRALIQHFCPDCGLEISHICDLPSKTGIGSSSTFLVCLLHALSTYKNISLNKKEFADKAIWFEQEVLKECIGYQDAIWAVYGGFNQIRFNKDGYKVESLAGDKYTDELEQHLLLFYTGSDREAQSIAKSYANNLHEAKYRDLQNNILKVAEKGVRLIENNDVEGIGELLHENWVNKRSLSDTVSNTIIDEMYDTAIQNGATGCKLLGAGGSGMFLVHARPKFHKRIKDMFAEKVFIPFKFEVVGGSRVILNNGA